MSVNKNDQKDDKRLFNWKMIRIPRIVFHVFIISLIIVALFASLVVAIRVKGKEFPMLVQIGEMFGITAGQREEAEIDSDIMETHFARLVYVKGDVTVKAHKELRFEKAEKGQILHEGDSIRTFSGGYTEVRFDEGNRLTIKPDSLVVIRDMKENRLTKIRRSSINLLQSDVEAVVRPTVEGSEFVIETPTAMAKISEAKVAVQVSKENDSQVKVFRGAVNLKVGEESVEVSEDQAVDISRERKIEKIKNLPPAPVLVSPDNLAEYFFKSLNEMKSILEWKHTLKDIKYRIQVALDPFFTDFVIVRTGLSDTGVLVQGLKSGIYYWRVSAVNADGLEGDFSDYRVFKVSIDQTPPEIELDDVLILKVSGKVNAQISGQTEPDASVSINGVSVQPDKTGRFKHILSHVASNAVVTVVAKDRVGNENVLKKSIQIQ